MGVFFFLFFFLWKYRAHKELGVSFPKDRLCVKYHFKGTVLSCQIWELLIHSEPVWSLRSSGMKPLSIPKLRLNMKYDRSQSQSQTFGNALS